MNREELKNHYHALLDESFNLTKEGHSIIGVFIDLVILDMATIIKLKKVKNAN